MDADQAREELRKAGVDAPQLRRVEPRPSPSPATSASAFPRKLPRPLAARLKMRGLPPIPLQFTPEKSS